MASLLRRGGCSGCACDGQPSTSGRGGAPARPVRSRGRSVAVLATTGTPGMPELYNTNPIKLHRQLGDTVIPGVRTTPTPRLTPERVLQRLAEASPPAAQRHLAAFYSSELGGIVTEPGFMVLPVDDAMVHAGDAVADAAPLVGGYVYQLDAHLARLAASAELAGLPMPMPEERMRRVLLDTAAAAMKLNGMLRFWISRGRGGLGLCEAEAPSLYALVSTETAYAQPDRDNGWRAVTSPVDPVAPYFVAARNASRIQGAVAKLEAASRDAQLALFVDDASTVLCGPDCTIALLTREGTLVVPPEDTGMAGMAARNLAELALKADDDNLPVSSVERRTFGVEELAGAAEAFAVSTEFGVVGISHVDGRWVGEHEFAEQAGPASLALNALLEAAREPRPGSAEHTEVPFGVMTGMRSQLR